MMSKPGGKPARAMMQALRVTVMTIVLLTLGGAGALATIAGAISVLDWATRTFGSLAVYIAGAFLAGVVVTHGVNRGIAAARHGAPPDG
jgi:hypothetical protein